MRRTYGVQECQIIPSSFIKANYPHHECIWGWDDAADQVVMMVQNIRKAIVEYHNILYDLGFNTTWDEAKLKIENL